MTRYPDLAGRVVLVTGGGRGLGEEIARAFHGEGCVVALNYNSSKEKAEKVADGLGEGVHLFGADVADRAQVETMVRGVESRLGAIDILVNNAGVSRKMELEGFDEATFELMWKVNVLGPVYTSLAVLGGMKKKRGNIINMASHAGVGNSRPGGMFYAATKSALIMLTKRMAVELGRYGIRVNAIAPGVIRTDPEGVKLGAEEEIAFEERLGLRRSLTIKGVPRHIADAALFLGSGASEYMTGQVLVVDGGRVDGVPRSV